MRSIRSDSAKAAWRDIEHHIVLAAQFVAGLDFQTFRDDLRTVYAVTRCLKIVSEASRRLPSKLKGRHPGIAWKDMAGAGNVYRHDYEDVAAKLVGTLGNRPCLPYSATVALRSGQVLPVQQIHPGPRGSSSPISPWLLSPQSRIASLAPTQHSPVFSRTP